MTRKSLLMACALTLSAMGIANAGTYDVTVNGPAKAGDVQLKPGTYGVRVEGSEAVFTRYYNHANPINGWDADAKGDPVSVPVKIERTGVRSDRTVMGGHNDDGVENVQQINLGGTDTRLVFGQ